MNRRRLIKSVLMIENIMLKLKEDFYLYIGNKNNINRNTFEDLTPLELQKIVNIMFGNNFYVIDLDNDEHARNSFIHIIYYKLFTMKNDRNISQESFLNTLINNIKNVINIRRNAYNPNSLTYKPTNSNSLEYNR
jgi:hypothetical protein